MFEKFKRRQEEKRAEAEKKHQEAVGRALRAKEQVDQSAQWVIRAQEKLWETEARVQEIMNNPELWEEMIEQKKEEFKDNLRERMRKSTTGE